MSLKGFNGTWNCGKHEIFSLIRRRTKRGLIYRRGRISCQCQTVMVGHRCCWHPVVLRFPCIQVYAKWAWWIITFLQVEAPKKLFHRRDSWQLLQYASLIPLEIWFRCSNLIFSLSFWWKIQRHSKTVSKTIFVGFSREISGRESCDARNLFSQFSIICSVSWVFSRRELDEQLSLEQH